MKSIVDISEILLSLGIATETEEERALASESLRQAEASVRRYLKYDPVQLTRTEFYPRTDFTSQGLLSVYEVTDTTAYIRRLSEASTDELQVQHIPIRSVTTLHVDYDGRAGTQSGSFDSSTLRTLGTDYWPNFDSVDSASASICRDGIIRSEGRWPNKAGSVKLVYIAGYTDEELHGQDSVVSARPIVDAVIDETTRKFLKIYSRKKKSQTGFAGPFSSESLGDYAYTLDRSVRTAIISSGDISVENQDKLSDFVNYGAMIAS